MKRLIALLALGLLSATTFAQELTPDAKTRTLTALQQTIARQAFVPGVDFSKLPAALEKRKPELDRANTPVAFAGAVNLALRDFGISHIRFLTPTAARQRATGQVTGFGLTPLPGAEGLTIGAIAPGSGAAGVGLTVGDTILEVEGQHAASPLDIEQDGRETSLVTVKRKADSTIKHYMLLRKPYSTDRKPVLTWPAPGIARLTLASFTRGYSQPEIDALMTEAAKAKALILDLRNNGGGLVNNSAHLLSLLLPPGTSTGTSVTRQVAEQYTKETGKPATDPVAIAKWKGATRKTTARKVPPYKGKVAVLINRRSGSASEIVSSVLREERNATLIGQPSAGAVLTSIFARLPEGFEVQLPLSDYLTPKGVRLEKNPVKPDITVEGIPARDEAQDPALQAAIKTLTK